jgi:hypothetical protein
VLLLNEPEQEPDMNRPHHFTLGVFPAVAAFSLALTPAAYAQNKTSPDSTLTQKDGSAMRMKGDGKAERAPHHEMSQGKKTKAGTTKGSPKN